MYFCKMSTPAKREQPPSHIDANQALRIDDDIDLYILHHEINI